MKSQKVYPLVTMADLRLDLLPIVRNLAHSAHVEHPWMKMSDEELVRSAGFITRDIESGKEGVNVAGILCLGKDDIIRAALPAYKTDAYTRRENVNRYDDRVIVTTNLLESYDQLFAFGQKHLDDKFYLERDQRVSIRDKILREILGNLLIHREYSSSMSGRFIIERDRIIADNANRTVNPGRITPENLKPVSKNPIIAAFFRGIGRADELGSGVRNLYGCCAQSEKWSYRLPLESAA